MDKNDHDHAIVVGIKVYADKDFPNLCAPENDAHAFYDWLVSDTGGKLLKKNVQLILSSDYKQPFASASKAKPTERRIEDAFGKLDEIADKNFDAGLGRQVGRRLYLFFAGHGCAPSSPSSDEALLLTANVTGILLGANIPGKMYADWYVRSGYFREAVVLMDCCRDVIATAPINVPRNKEIIQRDAIEKGVVFYGFATKWSRKARERPFNGKWQGVFTKALLTGLEGAAADTKNARITAGTLRDYLYNSWRGFLSPQDLADDNIPKEPEVWVRPQSPGAASALVFCTLPGKRSFPVTVSFGPAHAGKTARIEDSDFQAVASTVVGPGQWQIDLARGLYCIYVDANLEKCFPVDGTGAVNVNL